MVWIVKTENEGRSLVVLYALPAGGGERKIQAGGGEYWE